MSGGGASVGLGLLINAMMMNRFMKRRFQDYGRCSEDELMILRFFVFRLWSSLIDDDEAELTKYYRLCVFIETGEHEDLKNL